VLLAVESEERGIRVTVAPATHSVPDDEDRAVALPAKVGRHPGLDDEPSWIVADEMNRFTWPGPDLRPVPGSRLEIGFAYGTLPENLFEELRRKIVALHRAGRVSLVDRPSQNL
jgi:hypothetical protein